MTRTTAPVREQHPPGARRSQRALLWGAGLLLAGGLPVALTGPPWSAAAGADATGVLLLLWRIAAFVRRWAPTRSGLAVLAAISVFGWATTLITALPPVGHRLSAMPVAVGFLLVNGLKVISVAPVALIARRHHWSAADLALHPGDPNAPAGPRVHGTTLSWAVAGPLIIVLTLLLFATGIPYGALGRAVPWLPVIAVGALVNAAAEEFLYRHAAIYALRDAIGATEAMFLTSVMFGLAHFTGNPGGVTGVLFTTMFGFVCAHAMLRTRGFAWNLPIHFAGDVGVCVTLVASAH
jgi:hypothetical protein